MQLLELSKKYGIAVITISLFLILSLTTEGFFTERNIRNLLDQQSTILIAASFMTIVIISGNFDISISAIFVVAPLFALNIENATGNILLSVLGGIPVMEKVGVPIAVENAIMNVKEISIYITKTAGGYGAFRESVSWIIEQQGRMDDILKTMKEHILKS